MVKLISSRKTLTKKDRVNIIWATYGSLTNFKHAQYGCAQVGKMLGLTKQVVWNTLNTFKLNNYDIEKAMVVHPSKRKRKLIRDAELEQYLTSEECLKKWAHLSIVKRLEVIRRKWKLIVTAYQLRRLYTINKIKWRRAYYAMKGAT